MTIIITAVGPDFVMIAADSMRSADNGTNFSVEKIRQLSTKALVAKGGFGDLTDTVWDQLEALSATIRNDVRLLASEAWKLGKPVYEAARDVAIKQGSADLGLFLIVAGLDQNDSYFLAALNFGLNEFKEYEGADGLAVIGLGSIPEAQSIASDIAIKVLKSAGNLLPEEWAKRVVQQGAIIDPKTIGFPAHGKVLRHSGIQEFTIGKAQPPAKP